MKVGDCEWRAKTGPYSIDNFWRNGEIVPNEYCILHDGHEIAWGHDPVELLRIVDAANAAADLMEQAA